ncbi:MAG: formimidoylglutamate deiminase [Pseudomonadota bacterium]
MQVTKQLWAGHALTAAGWQRDVLVQIDEHGTIGAVDTGQPRTGEVVDILLPAMCNLHSHAFQRAMAGMTETRGDDPQDSFWTWRKLMYRFLDQINPQDAQAIAAFGQVEMLEAGYTSVGEFHYLHHQPDGKPYLNSAEMSERMIAASLDSGIGLTLLPVMYEQGGCDGRALYGGQLRFGHTLDEFYALYKNAERSIADNAPNANLGVAPHSLRAVSRDSLQGIAEFARNVPVHIHVAEQQAEVDELLAAYNARPVQWLLANLPVDESWCLVHSTQMTDEETRQLAASGAVAGLCPVTEANLGDGMFNGVLFKQCGGVFGIGTDSNVCISLAQELQTLEYSQRLRHQARAVYADTDRSTARVLYESSLVGGARALQRNSGQIAVGCTADLLSLDSGSVSLASVSNDGWLDAWLFASNRTLVSDVWAAGRQVVSHGRHVNRDRLEGQFRQVLQRLLAA